MLSNNTSKVLWVSVAVGSMLGLGTVTNALFPDAFTAITDTVKSVASNYSGDPAYDPDAPKAENTDYTYSYNGQYATVTGLKMGLGTDKKYPNAVIPEKINYGGKTYTINAIGDNAFSNNESGYQMTSVSIPDTVTSIGAWAFAHNSLTSVPMSADKKNNISTLGKGAFAYNKLTQVIVPDNITSIGTMVFENNNISKFTWSKNLTSIPAQTFSDNSLTDVSYIPDTVTDIGDYAFDDNLISSLTIGKNIKTLGNHSFSHNKLTTLTIPTTVTSVGDSAFSNNSLTSLNLDGSTKNTGDGAYSYNQLTSVTIPSTWTTIPTNIFSNNNLKSITIPSTITTINYYAFGDNSISTLAIPNSVKSIQAYAFHGAGIKTLTLGSGLTDIENNAFDSNMITSLSVPDTVTTIGDSAFESNDIRNLAINKKTSKLETIGNRAFYDNVIQNVAGTKDKDQYIQNMSYDSPAGSNTKGILTNTKDGLVFPDSLTSIGDQAFADSKDDSNLDSPWAVIKFNAGLTHIGKNAFDSFTHSDNSNATLTILFEVKNQNYALVQNQTLSIDDGAFADNIIDNGSGQNSPTQALRFPDYVSSIGANVITDNADAKSNNKNISVYADTQVDSSAFSSDYQIVTRDADYKSTAIDSAQIGNTPLAYVQAWAK